MTYVRKDRNPDVLHTQIIMEWKFISLFAFSFVSWFFFNTFQDSRSLGHHVERWHIRHYTEVKEIVDLAKRLRNYIHPEESQQEQEQVSRQVSHYTYM